MKLYLALARRAEILNETRFLDQILEKTRRQDRYSMGTNERVVAEDVDMSRIREKHESRRHAARKINAAIQQVNFATQVEFDGEGMTLAEALELRKSTHANVVKLEAEAVEAAFRNLTHLEHKIVDLAPERTHTEVNAGLESERRRLRGLRQMCTEATFTLEINFEDHREVPQYTIGT